MPFVRIAFQIRQGVDVIPFRQQRDRLSDERLANARAALETDPAVQALRTQMGATIFADSVRPNHTEEN